MKWFKQAPDTILSTNQSAQNLPSTQGWFYVCKCLSLCRPQCSHLWIKSNNALHCRCLAFLDASTNLYWVPTLWQDTMVTTNVPTSDPHWAYTLDGEIGFINSQPQSVTITTETFNYSCYKCLEGKSTGLEGSILNLVVKVVTVRGADYLKKIVPWERPLEMNPLVESNFYGNSGKNV